MIIMKEKCLILNVILATLISCATLNTNSNQQNKDSSSVRKMFLRIYKQDCKPKSINDEVFVIVDTPPVLQNSNEQELLSTLNESTVLSREFSELTLVGTIIIDKDGRSCLSSLMGQFQYKLDYDLLAEEIKKLE